MPARPPTQPLRLAPRPLLQLRLPSHDKLAALPNSLLTITLTSNFGTFILYALSCFLCIVAFHKRPDYNFLKHLLIPGFGLIANLVCMGFYVAGPFFNLGTKMEPCALWVSRPPGAFTGPSISSGPRRPRARLSCSNPIELSQPDPVRRVESIPDLIP